MTGLRVPTTLRLARLLLLFAGVLIALPALMTLAGGFAPTMPTVGPFGALLNAGLPWVWASAVAGAALSLLAILLGGGWVARSVAACLFAGVLGAGLVTLSYMNFARDNGTAFSIARQLDGVSRPEPDDTVTVASVGGVELRAAIWFPPKHQNAAAKHYPAIVYVHGGAFVTGGLGMRTHLFDAWSNAGLVVIDVEYRLAPPPRWDQAPGDVLCALAWVVDPARAATLAIDPDAIVVVGESAGGNLALVAGFAAATDAIAPSCPGEPRRPAGIVAVAPTADLVAMWKGATLTAGDLRFPEVYLGGSPSAVPERYAAASPGWLINASVPRTLLLTGANDRIVPPATVQALADQLRSAGADVHLLVAPFSDHGFDAQANGFGAQIEERLIPDFVRSVTGGQR